MIKVRKLWSLPGALKALNLSHNTAPLNTVLRHQHDVIKTAMTSSRTLNMTAPLPLESPPDLRKTAEMFRITEAGLLDTTTGQSILHFESRHCCKCSVCWNVHRLAGSHVLVFI